MSARLTIKLGAYWFQEPNSWGQESCASSYPTEKARRARLKTLRAIYEDAVPHSKIGAMSVRE